MSELETREDEEAAREACVKRGVWKVQLHARVGLIRLNRDRVVCTLRTYCPISSGITSSSQ